MEIVKFDKEQIELVKSIIEQNSLIIEMNRDISRSLINPLCVYSGYHSKTRAVADMMEHGGITKKAGYEYLGIKEPEPEPAGKELYDMGKVLILHDKITNAMIDKSHKLSDIKTEELEFMRDKVYSKGFKTHREYVAHYMRQHRYGI